MKKEETLLIFMKLIQKYIERKRPPIELRDQISLDILLKMGRNMRVLGKIQSINVKTQSPVAEQNTSNHEKYGESYVWKRASLKWEFMNQMNS